MHKVLLSFAVSALLLTAPFAAMAADPGQQSPTGPGAAQTAPDGKAAPATPRPSTPRSEAAEARYRAWVDREHARDNAEFAKEKSKIEDKYKGYVRPKRDPKDAKTAPASAKAN